MPTTRVGLGPTSDDDPADDQGEVVGPLTGNFFHLDKLSLPLARDARLQPAWWVAVWTVFCIGTTCLITGVFHQPGLAALVFVLSLFAGIAAGLNRKPKKR